VGNAPRTTERSFLRLVFDTAAVQFCTNSGLALLRLGIGRNSLVAFHHFR
jgi:hypothetical protein